jgi:isopentenyl-diphosphate delta-isomerase
MVKLVIVNKNDKEIGLGEKLKTHLGKGILHRAFTIFVFNPKGQLLIQKRSKNKFLWPLIWETTCSTSSKRRLY